MPKQFSTTTVYALYNFKTYSANDSVIFYYFVTLFNTI